MIQILKGTERPGCNPVLDNMFRDRKRVFVDLLKWDVPVVDDVFEIDQFDGPQAIYCIVTDEFGAHQGSIRLLPTDVPHILGSIFPQLCCDPVPAGEGIWELSRGCLSRALRAPQRLYVRNMLTTAVVEYALLRGISTYTCIADSGWLSQILSLGWDCRPLGFALCRDPAWDMLLDLYLAHFERRAVYLWALCHVSNVPAPSADRKVRDLVRDGLVLRSRDHGDRRRVSVRISERGLALMNMIMDGLVEQWDRSSLP